MAFHIWGARLQPAHGKQFAVFTAQLQHIQAASSKVVVSDETKRLKLLVQRRALGTQRAQGAGTRKRLLLRQMLLALGPARALWSCQLRSMPAPWTWAHRSGCTCPSVQSPAL